MELQWRIFGDYKISNAGDVYSIKRNKILAKKPGKSGYISVILSGKTYRVNRLVATLFIPNPNNLPYVNHKDGDKTNNNVENLEWCDARYNALHAINHKLFNPKRPIICITTGKEYESIKQACDDLGITRGIIKKYLNPNPNIKYDLIFKYKKEE